MDLIQLLKTGRPSVGLENIRRVGLGLDNAQDGSLDFSRYLEHLMLMSGMNHIIQVNDMETYGDWTESDSGTLDVTQSDTTTGKRVGTNNILLTNTAATDGTQYIQSTLINESAVVPESANRKKQMDWRDTKYLGGWKHAESSAHYGTAGELSVAIVNNGVLQTAQDLPAQAGTEHRYWQIDMEAAGWDRDKVESIRFYSTNTNAAEAVYLDEIQRYAIQFNGGPWYGSALPIKSATTLNENHWSKWTIDGVIASSSAAAIADIGPAWLGSSSLTGNAQRNKWAIFPGARFCLIAANAATVAGEGLEWAANGLAAGVATGVDENGFAKGLEAAGAQYDSIFAQLTPGGNFIS